MSDNITEKKYLGLESTKRLVQNMNNKMNDALLDKLSYNEQTLTYEQKAQARANIRAAIDIYDIVSPEMFGAVGDGVTDDSAAFISALSNGKKVVCDSTKTYYFANPIDVRTLTSGHLDGNNAYFINFHIYININDDFTDWRAAYSPNKFIIENMNFCDRDWWNVAPVGWETPLITTGSGMIVRNIKTTYPYILATVDEYIDHMLFEGWNFCLNSDLLSGSNFELDAISCLSKNGQYCRISSEHTPNSAGDSWQIIRCNEFAISGHPDYKMMMILNRRPLYVESCVQSSFGVTFNSKVVFRCCHWETKSSVKFESTYLTQVTFDNCFFYDNYVLNNHIGTRYQNCTFATTFDAQVGGYTLANMTNNVSFYDLQCELMNCNFGGRNFVDTRKFKDEKITPKNTYNFKGVHYRTKLNTKTLSVYATDRKGQFFDATGTYTYDINIKATSLPNIAIDNATLSAMVANANSDVRFGMQFINGGFAFVVFRTAPNGAIEKCEIYQNPNYFDDDNTYVQCIFHDYGSYAELNFEDAGGRGIADGTRIAPWVAVEEKQTFTVNEVLYEGNGVLVTSDGSTPDVGVNERVVLSNYALKSDIPTFGTVTNDEIDALFQ